MEPDLFEPTLSLYTSTSTKSHAWNNSPLKALLASFAKAHKGAGKTKWVNSPNVYQKVEVLETGTPDPKKITKVQVMTIQDSKK